MTNATDLTADTVETLRIEAGIAGDSEMVDMCDRWMEDEHTAADVQAIVDALNDAAAQR